MIPMLLWKRSDVGKQDRMKRTGNISTFQELLIPLALVAVTVACSESSHKTTKIRLWIE